MFRNDPSAHYHRSDQSLGLVPVSSVSFFRYYQVINMERGYIDGVLRKIKTLKCSTPVSSITKAQIIP